MKILQQVRLLIIAGLCLLAAQFAVADPVQDLVNFSAGSTARASEVNGNFTTIANAVNDIDARIVLLETSNTEILAANAALQMEITDLKAAINNLFAVN